MKQFTFKDGFKCIASTKEEAIKKHKVTATSPKEAGAKHSVVVAKGANKKPLITKERKRIEDGYKKFEDIFKTKEELRKIISVDISRNGAVYIGLNDEFNLKLGDSRWTIDQDTVEFSSIEDALSSLSKNKDKWIELVKCAKRVEQLCEELGIG